MKLILAYVLGAVTSFALAQNVPDEVVGQLMAQYEKVQIENDSLKHQLRDCRLMFKA